MRLGDSGEVRRLMGSVLMLLGDVAFGLHLDYLGNACYAGARRLGYPMTWPR